MEYYSAVEIKKKTIMKLYRTWKNIILSEVTPMQKYEVVLI